MLRRGAGPVPWAVQGLGPGPAVPVPVLGPAVPVRRLRPGPAIPVPGRGEAGALRGAPRGLVGEARPLAAGHCARR